MQIHLHFIKTTFSFLLLIISLHGLAGEKQSIFPEAATTNQEQSVSTNSASDGAQAAALAFIESQLLKLKSEFLETELVLEKRRESLLGTHFYFRQRLQGIPIEGAFLTVSVDGKNQVYKTRNTTFKIRGISDESRRKYEMESHQALQTLFDHLGASGTLMALPEARLFYRQVENADQPGVFQLVYRMTMPLSHPLGYWLAAIDAIGFLPGEVAKPIAIIINMVAARSGRCSSLTWRWLLGQGGQLRHPGR